MSEGESVVSRYDLAVKVWDSLWQGAKYTVPIVAPANFAFVMAKTASTQNIGTVRAFSVAYNGSVWNLFQRLPLFAAQQGVRILGKSSIFVLFKPYVDAHYSAYQAGVMVPTALTLMDGLLTPIEAALTRQYLGQPITWGVRALYRGTLPQTGRHGVIWFNYATIKKPVDAGYHRLTGWSPDSLFGCIATAPVIGVLVTLPVQPLFTVEACRQAPEVVKGLGVDTTTPFRNIAMLRVLAAERGVLALWRGSPATAFGLGCLASVANRLIAYGRQQQVAKPHSEVGPDRA